MGLGSPQLHGPHLSLSAFLLLFFLARTKAISLTSRQNTIVPCWCFHNLKNWKKTRAKFHPVIFNLWNAEEGKRTVNGGNYGYHKHFKSWTFILMGITVGADVVNRRRQRVCKYECSTLYVSQQPQTGGLWVKIATKEVWWIQNFRMTWPRSLNIPSLCLILFNCASCLFVWGK